MNAPCFGCQNRAVGCHASCGDFKAYAALRTAMNEAEKAESRISTAVFEIAKGKTKRVKRLV